MSYFSDLLTAIKGEFIALDEFEAAIIGAPDGQTLSYFSAFEAKHGRVWAHVMCAVLWIVKAHHCRDQLMGVPMSWSNYLRAGLLVFGVPYFLILIIWRLL